MVGIGGAHLEEHAFDTDLATLTEEASRVSPGCDGLTWIPYLQGERVPDLPGATGAIVGMRSGHLARGTLFRAAVEGTSLNLGWGVDRMRPLGIDVDAVHLVGGASRNPLWRAVLADVLRCPVEPLTEPESGALGAALQAIWTQRIADGDDVTAHEVAEPFLERTGERSEPDDERARVYAELGERFRGQVRQLFPDA